MDLLVAVAGLSFLVLIHEAGHFTVALAVGMVGFAWLELVYSNRADPSTLARRVIEGHGGRIWSPAGDEALVRGSAILSLPLTELKR